MCYRVAAQGAALIQGRIMRKFGVYSKTCQAFLSEDHDTPGDAAIEMLDVLRDLPPHDLVDAYADISVREVQEDGAAGEKNLSEFIGPVLEALKARQQ